MKKLTVLCMLGLFVLISANTDSIAAPREDTVKKCNDGKDNDGDGLIDFGDGPLNDPDCDFVGEDPGPGPGKTVATFDVELIMGHVGGSNTTDWLKFSTKGVGHSDPHFPAGTLDLDVFLDSDFDHLDQDICFGVPFSSNTPDSILFGHVRERKQGSAEVVLLFDGKTGDGNDDDVVYRLLMTSDEGTIPANWLPAKNSFATIYLTDWKVGVAGSQSPDLEPRSCADSGSFGATPQSVTVTRTD